LGAAGGELAVDAVSDPLAGARLTVPPDAVTVDTEFTLAAEADPPLDAPLGLFPAGYYWTLSWSAVEQTESLGVPATLALPLPGEPADTPMFVGGWTGEEWIALDGETANGEIAAAVENMGVYAAFCGELPAYRIVGFTNTTRSREIEIALVAGPALVDDADTQTVVGCPPPTDAAATQSVRRRSTVDFLLRPGRYEMRVTYLLPEPAVIAVLMITVPPGEEPISVEIAEDGATVDDAAVEIEFAGRGE
jgi:hypothetical protein